MQAWLTKEWGEPFEAKKRSVWLDEEERWRADLYGRGSDGVFLEVGPYTPWREQMQRAIDVVTGARRTLPLPGMTAAQVRKSFPMFTVEPTRVIQPLLRMELSALPGYWQGDFEGQKLGDVRLGWDFQATSKKAPALLAPFKTTLAGLSATKANGGTLYEGKGPCRLFVGKPLPHLVLRAR